MKKIAIITDTDSSLPLDLADEYGIQQVPILVNFGQESFASCFDINDKELFERIDREKVLPTTAAPSPGDFAKAYHKAFEDGADSIVCICVSSEVSATYAAAVNACDLLPNRDITVVDSLQLSMGQGLMVLVAAEAAQEGASVDEIVSRVKEVGKRIHLYAALPTLKYLALSGRVSKFVAGMASTLNIKPILTIKDGKLDLLERIRTWGKATQRVLELTGQAIDGKKIERVAFVHINNPEGATKLQEQFCAAFSCPDSIITAEFTAGLSVHAGSGVVGVVVLTES